MSLSIVYSFPTLNCFDTANESIWSAVNGTYKPTAVVVADNSAGQFVPEYQDTTILVMKENVGVARAWNSILKFVDEYYPDAYVLMANDDLILNPTTIADFVAGIEANPGEIIYCTTGVDKLNAFSLYACKPSVLRDTVGWFDREFWPAYFEDNDMAYRLELYGKPLCRIPATIKEHKSSSTINRFSPERMQQHHRDFDRNRSYYVKKWGGEPHNEKYKVPFNGKVPT